MSVGDMLENDRPRYAPARGTAGHGNREDSTERCAALSASICESRASFPSPHASVAPPARHVGQGDLTNTTYIFHPRSPTTTL